MTQRTNDRLRRLAIRLSAATAGVGADWPSGSEPPEGLAKRGADATQVVATRCHAIDVLGLRLRTEHRLTDLLRPLLDDPEPAVAEAAIRNLPAFDPRVAQELLQRIDCPTYRDAGPASLELSRRKDMCLLPRLVAWLEGADLARVGWALAALRWLVDPEAEAALLERIIEQRACDEGCLRIAERIDELEADSAKP